MHGSRLAEILILHPGDTPWSYRRNPGQLAGPWPGKPESAVRKLASVANLPVDAYPEWWIRGTSLWVVFDPKYCPGFLS